jgi:hypothetical protein
VTAGATRYLREDATWATVSASTLGAVPSTRQILAGPGLSGGGDLSQDRTISGVVFGASGIGHAVGIVPDPGGTAGATRYLREDAAWAVLTAASLGAVPTTFQVIAGVGLSGGGPLSGSSVTLDAVVFGASGVGHAVGIVPDPGALAGATRFLREDATWVALTMGDDTSTQRVQAALAGTLVAARHQLNFVAGSGTSLNVVDNPGANRVDITLTLTGTGPASPSIYAIDGTAIGTQSELNLITGSGTVLTGVNNTGAGRVDITIAASGSGSQSPWVGNIDAAAHNLNNVGAIGVGHASTTFAIDAVGDINVSGVYRVAGQPLAAANVVNAVSTIGSYPNPAWITSLAWGKITGAPATVLPTRQVLAAGPGFSGGGDLSADRTFTTILMGASGASHAAGMVPDPGATAGATRYLREDASWAVPPGGGAVVSVFGRTGAVVFTAAEIMGASGAAHALGVVPDPGATAGVTRFLREDASWAVPAGGAGTPAGATGDVQFRSAAGAFAADTGLFVWDATNHRLGVGVSAPAAQVQIQSAAGVATWLNLTQAGTASWDLKTVPNVNALTIGVSGSEIVRITAAGLVGIGTTVPSATLSVFAGVLGTAVNNTLGIASFGHNSGNSETLTITAIRVLAGSGWTYNATRIQATVDATSMSYIDFNPVGGSVGGSLAFGKGSTEYVRVSGDGLVGVGTASPQTILHAYRTVNGGNVAIAIDNDGTTPPLGQVLQFRYGAQGVLGGIYHQTPAGSPWYLRFKCWNNSAEQERITIVGDSGYVGIGNPSPLAALTVGSGNSATSISTTGDVGTGAWIRNDGSNLVLSTNVGGIYIGFGGNTAKTINIGNTGTGVVNITGSAPSNSVIVDASGNVTMNGLCGIGVAPGYKLQVNGMSVMYSASIASDFQNSALQIRETNQADGGASGDNRYAPRISFHWTGVTAAQIGMDNAGTIRTFDNPGTGYANFACAGLTCTGVSCNGVMNATQINLSANYSLRAAGEIQCNGSNYAFRSVVGNYGAIWYNDGGSYYLLLTNSGDPFGAFSGLRPFAVNMSNGAVTMAHPVTMNSTVSVGGQVSVSGGLTVAGNVQASSNLFVTGQMTVGPAYSNQAGDLGIARASAPGGGCLFYGNGSGGASQYLFYDGTNFYLTNSLKITGNCTVTGSYLTSDARLKQGVRDLSGGLSFIEKLKPKEFEWNGLGGTPAGQHSVSLIAQDLQEVFPASVAIWKAAKLNPNDPEMEILSYNPNEIVMQLVLAVQQLEKRLKALEPVN